MGRKEFGEQRPYFRLRCSKANMSEHIDEIPEEKKPSQCSICDNNYTTKGSLKIHMDAVHEAVQQRVT